MMRNQLALFTGVLACLTACVSKHTPPSRIYYSGPTSDHFDGQRFFNPEGDERTGGSRNDRAGDFLRIATGKAGHHSSPRSLPVIQAVPPRRVVGDEMRVTWIGHATTLIQTQGLNILLDLVWAWRDSPIQLEAEARAQAWRAVDRSAANRPRSD